MKRGSRLSLALCSALALCLWALVRTAPAHACNSYSGCLVSPATGIQPCLDEASALITSVSQNKFGSNGPAINTIYSGTSGQRVTATMPCVFYKAVIYVESSWTMFCASACGSSGQTVVSNSCGFGYSQITWGMKASHGNISVNYDRNKVANDPTYNLATGLQFMADNWNTKPYFEGRDPEIIEHWYFAAWRYNNYVWTNNPNNPNYDANRVPLNCSGSGSASKYPYPERVWGFMKCPAVRGGSQLWTGVDVTYPDPAIFCNTADCTPSTATPYSFRLPHHRDPCQVGESGAPYDSTSDTDGDGVLDYLDCAPNDARIYPGAQEVCDGVDNDCDGTVDEGAMCAAGYSCKNGSCVADQAPTPEPPDAGTEPAPVDAAMPTPDDAGEAGADASSAPEPDLIECATHDQCPDGNTCVKGQCVPELEFDPLPDEMDGDLPSSEELVYLNLNSGCGCHSTAETPGGLIFLLGLLVLVHRRFSDRT